MSATSASGESGGEPPLQDERWSAALSQASSREPHLVGRALVTELELGEALAAVLEASPVVVDKTVAVPLLVTLTVRTATRPSVAMP